MVVVPHLYLDSNVIIEIIEGQKQESAYLIENAKENGWVISTSNFTLMELLDVRQDNAFILKKLGEGDTPKKILRQRYDKDLSLEILQDVYKKVKNKFLIPYKSVNFLMLTENGWNKATDICTNSNISAPDCIHVATALEAGCDIFVTSDGFLKKKSSEFIKACLSGDVNITLRELGFDV